MKPHRQSQVGTHRQQSPSGEPQELLGSKGGYWGTVPSHTAPGMMRSNGRGGGPTRQELLLPLSTSLQHPRKSKAKVEAHLSIPSANHGEVPSNSRISSTCSEPFPKAESH